MSSQFNWFIPRDALTDKPLLRVGTPVRFKGLVVGYIGNAEYREDTGEVIATVTFDPPYKISQ